MKKYNREKRGTYNARIRNIRTHEICDEHATQKRIHIRIHYDGYNHIEYIPVIYGKTRNNKAHMYTSMTNAMREIFPEIDTQHTQHVYRATCEYHKFIPQETDHTRPEPEPDTIITNTHTTKCIIMNDEDKVLYIGMMRRTRTINITKGTIDITLHKGTRTMKAYERAINLDTRIHNITVREIRTHGVEIYHI